MKSARRDLLLVAAVASCVVSSVSLDGKPSFAPSADPPVHLVTGGGQVDVTSVWPGAADATIAFIVQVDDEGNAIGEMQAHFSVPDETVHLDLTCLSVKGNEAWIGGTVTQSDPTGNLLDHVYIVRVQDNGQGRGRPPDRMSFFRAGGALGPARCLDQPADGEFDLHFPWVSGNIQIR